MSYPETHIHSSIKLNRNTETVTSLFYSIVIRDCPEGKELKFFYWYRRGSREDLHLELVSEPMSGPSVILKSSSTDRLKPAPKRWSTATLKNWQTYSVYRAVTDWVEFNISSSFFSNVSGGSCFMIPVGLPYFLWKQLSSIRTHYLTQQVWTHIKLWIFSYLM